MKNSYHSLYGYTVVVFHIRSFSEVYVIISYMYLMKIFALEEQKKKCASDVAGEHVAYGTPFQSR